MNTLRTFSCHVPSSLVGSPVMGLCYITTNSQKFLFQLSLPTVYISFNVSSENEVVHNSISNTPFPSSLVPLFQSESKCDTILIKMTLICMKMKLHAELIFI